MKGPLVLRCEHIPDLAGDYMDGGLSLWRRWQIRLHLAICVACTVYLAQLRKTVVLLRSVGPRPVEPAEEEKMLETLAQWEPPPP